MNKHFLILVAIVLMLSARPSFAAKEINIGTGSDNGSCSSLLNDRGGAVVGWVSGYVSGMNAVIGATVKVDVLAKANSKEFMDGVRKECQQAGGNSKLSDAIHRVWDRYANAK